MRTAQLGRELHKGGSFAGDVIKLATGSTSAQVISIMAAPLIARLFSPEAFGIAALFTSFSSVMSSVVGMRYELSIMLPAKDEEAANCVAVTLCFVVLTTLGSIGIVAIAGHPVLNLLNAPELSPYLRFVPAGVLIAGVYATLHNWTTRKREFGAQSTAQIAGAVAFVLVQIAAGATGHNSGGVMIVATLIAGSVPAVALGARIWQRSSRPFLDSVRLTSMLSVLRRYSSFPKYSTVSAALNTFGWQMPPMVFSSFFSTTVVGHYSLGNRLLRLPMNLVGSNITTVFFQHAARARHQGTLTQSVGTMFQYLVRIVMFPCLVSTFIGKDLFILVFGANWAEAGVYTQILSPWMLFYLIVMPLGVVLPVVEEQRLELRLTTVVFVTRIGSLVLGSLLGGPRLALLVFCASGVLVYGHYCITVLNRCGIPASTMMRTLLSRLAAFAPVGLLLAALEYLAAPPWMVLLIAVLVLVLYYCNLVRIDPNVRRVLLLLFRKAVPQNT